jgi:hypothetical protein
VRVLLDEQLPRQLSAYLVGHEVRTVQQQRWAGSKNGELLRLAVEAGFESVLTADHNLEYQQNLRAASLGIVVLVAASNALEDLLPLVPDALKVCQRSNPDRSFGYWGLGQPTIMPKPLQPTSGASAEAGFETLVSAARG